MQVFIDADGCPVVDLTIEISNKFGVECTILCDTSHEFNRRGAKTVTVEKGADSVDFKIVNMVKAGDIVVTQDYGLAAMCLARKAVPISQNGLVFNDKNIEELLYTRFISKKIRNAGGRTKGPSKRTVEQDKAFSEKFTALLADK